MMIRILIWALLLLGGGTLSIWLDIRWFRSLFSNFVFHILTLLVGFFILRLVMRASRNTGRLLAKLGRDGEVPRFETNRLVTTGVYSCMRHPMHFGLLFFPFAFAFILGSPAFILIVGPLEAMAMILLIILVEEPQAIGKFGLDYRKYMKEVPFFSLEPKCLKKLFGRTDFAADPETH